MTYEWCVDGKRYRSFYSESWCYIWTHVTVLKSAVQYTNRTSVPCLRSDCAGSITLSAVHVLGICLSVFECSVYLFSTAIRSHGTHYETKAGKMFLCTFPALFEK